MNPYYPQQYYQQQFGYGGLGYGQPMQMPPNMMPNGQIMQPIMMNNGQTIQTNGQPMSMSMPSIRPVNLQPINSECKVKERLPRTPDGGTINMSNGTNIMNITLNASTGNKTVINASPDTTIENLLKMYTQKLGLPQEVIGKEIMFLYNGAQLDFKCQNTIGSMFRNTAVITVYDLGGIIGA